MFQSQLGSSLEVVFECQYLCSLVEVPQELLMAPKLQLALMPELEPDDAHTHALSATH